MISSNRRVILATRPKGLPQLSDFELVSSPPPTAGPGECLVQGIYLSLDPYMRGRMDDRKSYAPSVQVGEVMVGQGVGRIVTSRHPGFRSGDLVVGDWGWQEQAVVPASSLAKVELQRGPISTALASWE